MPKSVSSHVYATLFENASWIKGGLKSPLINMFGYWNQFITRRLNRKKKTSISIVTRLEYSIFFILPKCCLSLFFGGFNAVLRFVWLLLQVFSIFSASCILKLKMCTPKSCDFCESGSFPSSRLQMQLFQPEEIRGKCWFEGEQVFFHCLG